MELRGWPLWTSARWGRTSRSPRLALRAMTPSGVGAWALVLETEQHARSRGAASLAEVAGYGASADAFHVTAPRDDGAGGALAIAQALRSAGAGARGGGFIKRHGP